MIFIFSCASLSICLLCVVSSTSLGI